jgi:hypothetical protein
MEEKQGNNTMEERIDRKLREAEIPGCEVEFDPDEAERIAFKEDALSDEDAQESIIDQWPAGMGSEYFYGFMGGDISQWQPYLFRNQTQIFPWVGKPGYNLNTDLEDEAPVGWSRSVGRDRIRLESLSIALSKTANVAQDVPALAELIEEFQKNEKTLPKPCFYGTDLSPYPSDNGQKSEHCLVVFQ